MVKLKLGLFLLVFTGMSCWLQGQQLAQFSLPSLNKYHFNPAYAGLDYSLSITAVTRRQWNGLARTPETHGINAHLPFYVAGGGIGMRLESDFLGSIRQIRFGFSYSYVMQFDRSILNFGIGAGIHQFSLNGTELRSYGGNYEGNIIDHQDPRIPNAKVNDVKPEFELGIYYVTDQFEGGLSIQNLGPMEFRLPTLSGDLKIASRPIIHLSGEYLFNSQIFRKKQLLIASFLFIFFFQILKKYFILFIKCGISSLFSYSFLLLLLLNHF